MVSNPEGRHAGNWRGRIRKLSAFERDPGARPTTSTGLALSQTVGAASLPGVPEGLVSFEEAQSEGLLGVAAVEGHTDFPRDAYRLPQLYMWTLWRCHPASQWPGPSVRGDNTSAGSLCLTPFF